MYFCGGGGDDGDQGGGEEDGDQGGGDEDGDQGEDDDDHGGCGARCLVQMCLVS